MPIAHCREKRRQWKASNPSWKNNSMAYKLEKLRSEHEVQMGRIQTDRMQMQLTAIAVVTGGVASPNAPVSITHLASTNKTQTLPGLAFDDQLQWIQRKYAAILSYMPGQPTAATKPVEPSHKSTRNAVAPPQNHNEDVGQYLQLFAGRKLNLYGKILTSCTFSTIDNQCFTTETFDLLCTITFSPPGLDSSRF